MTVKNSHIPRRRTETLSRLIILKGEHSVALCGDTVEMHMSRKLKSSGNRVSPTDNSIALFTIFTFITTVLQTCTVIYLSHWLALLSKAILYIWEKYIQKHSKFPDRLFDHIMALPPKQFRSDLCVRQIRVPAWAQRCSDCQSWRSSIWLKEM